MYFYNTSINDNYYNDKFINNSKTKNVILIILKTQTQLNHISFDPLQCAKWVIVDSGSFRVTYFSFIVYIYK